MLEIFTIGGGEYIVNVLNAVAAWCGGGGFRSLLTVVMVIGLMYSLLVVAFSMNWRMWLNWFLGSTLMYGALIVPTTSVKVTDRLNPALPAAVVDNVPVGLAVVASISSQTGDWMTRTAETVFTMPEALKLSTNGMIYGSRLFDRTRQFRIRDPRAKANVEEYIRQCLFYDFMLGHKDMGAVANSDDLLAAIGPGSPARGMRFVFDDNTSNIITCRAGYDSLVNTTIPAETNVGLMYEARRMYPNLADAAARTKLDTDLPLIGNAFFGSSQSAQQIFQQRALVDSFLEARANLGGADGDTFAIMRADEQARNTYTSIADQAMTWVPLLNIVLTVVFYAMFPVIFPLFLLPQTGVPAVKGYFTGFFYLAAWGPLYAVLHMFIMDRTAKGMQAVTDGAVTMATLADIDAVNADTATIAGFMMMSIPFLAAGMAKGAMAISSQATSMLAPAQGAAEAAAVERTTGNYSYGNTAFQNLTGNVRQADQFNSTPSFNAGMFKANFQNSDGTHTGFTASGSPLLDARPGMSSLGFTPQITSSRQAEFSQAASELEARRSTLSNAHAERVAAMDRVGYSYGSGWRTAAGTSSELSKGEGATTARTRNDGRSNNVSTAENQRLGSDANRTWSNEDQYSDVWTATAGVNGSGGIGTGSGAPGPKGELGVSVGGSAALARGNIWRDGLTGGDTVHNGNDRTNTSGQSRDVGDSTRHEINYSDRDSEFNRNEQFSENRNFVDKTLEELRSIERQQSEVEEASRSLQTSWTMREGGGTTVTRDMSQYVAAQYHETASAMRAEGYEVPLSPHSQNLTPAQMDARDMVVDRILDKYIDDKMAPVRDELVPPSLSMGHVTGPASFGEGDLRGSIRTGGGGGQPAAGSSLGNEVAAGIAGAGANIERGEQLVDAQRNRHNNRYNQNAQRGQNLRDRAQSARSDDFFDGDP